MTGADSRASALIQQLGLQPHPEGGYFREIHRSTSSVLPAGDRRGDRASLTVIYFLLGAGDVSRWHRVVSDESWHFHDGAAVELFVADPDFAGIDRRVIGRLDQGAVPVSVVSASFWQSARSTGAWSLVSCAVGPGFDFADFEMLRDRPEEAARFVERHPAAAVLL